MRDIVDWLVDFEKTAAKFYYKAAVYFFDDRDLSELARTLAGDEEWHAERSRVVICCTAPETSTSNGMIRAYNARLRRQGRKFKSSHTYVYATDLNSLPFLAYGRSMHESLAWVVRVYNARLLRQN